MIAMLRRKADEVFKRDTLIRRMVALYCATIVAVIVGGSLIVSTAVWPNYQRLEARESAARLHSVMQAVQAERDRLAELVNTNAVWDDAYLFVEGANPDFPAANLSPEALAQIDVDASLVIGDNDAVLFSGGRDPAAQTLLNAMRMAQRSASGLALGDSDAKTALVEVNGGVVIVSQRRIVHADGTGPSHGALIFARSINAELLGRMQNLTGTRFSLETGAIGAQAADVRASGRVSDAYGRQTIAVSVLGKPEVLALGVNTIIILVVATAGLLVLLATVFTIGMMKMVIQPVSSLAAAVEGADHERAVVTNAEGAPVEISELALAFDRALARLREESERGRQALASKAESDRANEAKSQFIANISHELRTPLNAIIGYSEMLQESALEGGRASEVRDFDRVISAAHHLLSLINSLLDFSKIEAGKTTVSLADVDVIPVMESVRSVVAPLAAAKGLSLVIEAEGSGSVRADPQKLSQCLINLLSNAVKFTETGSVRARAFRLHQARGEVVRFEIVDSGIGIERTALASLFQPFSQADDSITRRFGGTGLGLAITRELVRLMGGRVGVASKPGSGSRFVIDLPAAQMDIKRAA